MTTTPRLRERWRHLCAELFERGGLGQLFTQARNVLTGTVIIAAGLHAIQHFEKSSLPGMWSVHVAGYGVAALGAVLLLLNLIDGLRQLARRRQHMVLRVAAIGVYLAVSVRLVQVIVFFRATL